ncbi:hypothetical protein KEM56_003955 [Ascosphaera pollenicola]|nr:hypothetical protein KEM56_003955 [Ascosphaera pollenicola]
MIFKTLVAPRRLSCLARTTWLPCCGQRARYSLAAEPEHQPATIAQEFLKRCQGNGPQKRSQVLDLNQLRLLSATLNRSRSSGDLAQSGADNDGIAVPPGHHLVYFTPDFNEDELAADGSDRSCNPAWPFTRRMWAGGEIVWPRHGTTEPKPNLLRVGDNVMETTAIRSAEAKKVKTTGDDMIFVGVEKTFENDNGVALIDRRSTPSSPPPQQQWSPELTSPEKLALLIPKTAQVRKFRQSDVTLFRFSALTFNGHKVHYSHPWATAVEGHRGVVVHGPLNVINILDFWRDVTCRTTSRKDSAQLVPRRFEYRATSPLYAGEEYQLALEQKGDDIMIATIFSCEGKIAMKATIEG